LEPPRQANMKLTNIAVGPDGTAYVADSGTPGVYQISPEDGQLVRFFSAPNFTTLRGLAVDPTGEYLFFSDYELGLFGVSIADHKGFSIEGGTDINLGGVDGVYWYRDGLVLVQNGNKPQRVLRVALTPDRRRVLQAQSLLSAEPRFDSPSVAAINGSHLHVLANSHWNYYDAASGKPREGLELSAPVILDLDLEAGWNTGH
jgi:DNA-binding beta-propeller fold protein YncE